MQKTTKTRAQERQELIVFFYHHFLMKYKIARTEKFFKIKNFSKWQQTIGFFIFSKFNLIIDLIQKNLNKEWNFSQISNLDKGILVISIGEFFSKSTPRVVAISEAVKISKRYSGLQSYSFINKSLEIIFKDSKITI